ncbi:MAG: exodeoxyribonuclease V subunit alpha [Aeromicrobium sp.]|uniref:exodeoxyribonuclease V subunit alpha n=1 Tax=Aeromicrobium sp. TaxID=1871063 RepID=UPI0039E698BA
MTETGSIEALDPFDRRVVTGATGVLGALNAVGLLDASDVQVARALGRLGAEDDEAVLLAVALTVRAVRLGSSCVDLEHAVADLRVEAPDLALPAYTDDPAAWRARVAASPLGSGPDRVVIVEEPLLHLPRYHALEVSLCERLAARLGATPPTVDEALLDADLSRLFDGPTYAEQREAAVRAAHTWTSMFTGGPGTGKTTTIARLLVALRSQQSARDAGRPISVGLAAPTGKAAARVRESLAREAASPVFTADERAWLEGLPAVTLHRLLGARPDHRTAFRHHAGHALPYDVVVVDETSMVSLLMMERLVQATPAACRLVLVGDPDQLASVEAGAVLRDVVRGVGETGGCVTHLTRGHRFDGAVAELAEAVVAGDSAHALDVLTGGHDHVRLVDPDQVASVIDDRPRAQALALARASADGDAVAAHAALAEHRLLCAHREGPAGVAFWNDQLERVVRRFPDPRRPWFAGRPVLVTRNDPSLGVNNGDVGVVVEEDGRLVARLDTGQSVAAARLASAQSAYASTVHRSQGSEFTHVTLLLPDEDSLVLTRELLYTAVTRTRGTLTVVGTPEVVRHAIDRPTSRASGVERRLRTALG